MNVDVEVIGALIEEFSIGQILDKGHAVQHHHGCFFGEVEHADEFQKLLLEFLVKSIQKLQVLRCEQTGGEVAHSIPHHLVRLVFSLLLLKTQVDASKGKHAGLYGALDQSIVDDEHEMSPYEWFEVIGV